MRRDNRIDRSETWVFGYGSLIWRPAFAHVARVPARLRGWKRRFWQHSPDHRGTPERPGRVVTLLPDPAEATIGVAYLLASEATAQVLASLDDREKAGYERHEVRLQRLDDGARLKALVYVASEANPCYAGPAPVAQLAAEIIASEGPSGPNRLYLLQLHRALLDLGVSDPHIRALVEAVHAGS